MNEYDPHRISFSAIMPAAGRPSPSLCLDFDGRHPGRRSSAPFLRPRSKALQHDDRFTDLFPLLAQIGEHLQNVHDGRITQGQPRIGGLAFQHWNKPLKELGAGWLKRGNFPQQTRTRPSLRRHCGLKWERRARVGAGNGSREGIQTRQCPFQKAFTR
jgi:hypothetical protein